jgi:hypothetical protein
MLREECAVHNFDDEAVAFLEELPQAQAMGYIARSVPVAPLCALYESFLKCLQGDDEQEYRDMPDDGTIDLLQAAVLAVTLHESMPSIDDLHRHQRDDEDICKVVKHLESDGKVPPEGKYRREAPYCFMHNGLVLYRTLVGDDQSLCQAVLLPQSLAPRVMKALHNSPTYGHSGSKATLTIVRQHAYWKHMVKDIREFVRVILGGAAERVETCLHFFSLLLSTLLVWRNPRINWIQHGPRVVQVCAVVAAKVTAEGFDFVLGKCRRVALCSRQRSNSYRVLGKRRRVALCCRWSSHS